MFYKQLILSALSCCAVLLVANTSFASCSGDLTQMTNITGKGGTIHNLGCPLQGGNGINGVTLQGSEQNKCEATCNYPSTGGVSCHWTTGNWGNTLCCPTYLGGAPCPK